MDGEEYPKVYDYCFLLMFQVCSMQFMILGIKQDDTRNMTKHQDGKINPSIMFTMNILDILLKISYPLEKRSVTCWAKEIWKKS